jgi:predicted transcriptional regulator
MGTDATTEPGEQTPRSVGYRAGGGSPSDVVDQLKAELREKQATIDDLKKDMRELRRANTKLSKRIDTLEAKLEETVSDESQEDRLQTIIDEPDEATRAAEIAKLSDAQLRAYFKLRAGAPA